MQSYSDRLAEYGQFWGDNWSWMSLVVVGIIVILGSGCFAASVAETRNRSPYLHALAGIVIPIIYPAIILFTMPYFQGPQRTRKAAKQEKVTRMEGAPPPEGAPVLDGENGPEAITEEALGERVIQYDRNYFKKMTYDEKGNYRGPFQFRVNNEEFKVERIIDALDNVVIIENIDSDGKTQHLRIPYGRVETCSEIQ